MGGCFLHDVCLVGCFLGRMNLGTHEGCPYGVCMFWFIFCVLVYGFRRGRVCLPKTACPKPSEWLWHLLMYSFFHSFMYSFFYSLMYSGGPTPPLRWVFMFCRGIPCGARIHPPNTSPVYIHQKHPYAITQQTTCQSFTVPPNVGRWLAPLGWNNICVGDCNSWPSVPPGAWDIPLSIGRGSSWRFAVGCSDNRAWQVLTCRKYVL